MPDQPFEKKCIPSFNKFMTKINKLIKNKIPKKRLEQALCTVYNIIKLCGGILGN